MQTPTRALPLLLLLALALALTRGVHGYCKQPFGARASKTPTIHFFYETWPPLRHSGVAELSLSSLREMDLNDAAACEIRCVAASYKNVFHNLVDPAGAEAYVSIADMEAMTKLCGSMCATRASDAFWKIDIRSDTHVRPVSHQARMQMPPAHQLMPAFAVATTPNRFAAQGVPAFADGTYPTSPLF